MPKDGWRVIEMYYLREKRGTSRPKRDWLKNHPSRLLDPPSLEKIRRSITKKYFKPALKPCYQKNPTLKKKIRP